MKANRFRWANLVRNWIHQGFLYLDSTERICRAALQLILTIIIASTTSLLLSMNIMKPEIWVVSFLAAHTGNWVFNGNWWACILFSFPGIKNRGEVATCIYLNTMADRIKDSYSISGVMIFGSISRRQWHDRSDIDLRFLRRQGMISAFLAFALLTRERFFAFLNRQPLDLYLADDIGFLIKMRKDELPIFLKKSDPRLDEAYPRGKETRLKNLA